jgi:hypothetical protein
MRPARNRALAELQQQIVELKRELAEVRRGADTVIPVPFTNVVAWPERFPPVVPIVTYWVSKAPSRSFQFAQ